MWIFYITPLFATHSIQIGSFCFLIRKWPAYLSDSWLELQYLGLALIHCKTVKLWDAWTAPLNTDAKVDLRGIGENCTFGKREKGVSWFYSGSTVFFTFLYLCISTLMRSLTCHFCWIQWLQFFVSWCLMLEFWMNSLPSDALKTFYWIILYKCN